MFEVAFQRKRIPKSMQNNLLSTLLHLKSKKFRYFSRLCEPWIVETEIPFPFIYFLVYIFHNKRTSKARGWGGGRVGGVEGVQMQPSHSPPYGLLSTGLDQLHKGFWVGF